MARQRSPKMQSWWKREKTEAKPSFMDLSTDTGDVGNARLNQMEYWRACHQSTGKGRQRVPRRKPPSMR
jgi:hypothetical protein